VQGNAIVSTPPCGRELASFFKVVSPVDLIHSLYTSNEVIAEETPTFQTNSGYGAPCNMANFSKSRTSFVNARKVLRALYDNYT